MPLFPANQGRDMGPIRFVSYAGENPGFIGTRARSVVAPTGFERLCTLDFRGVLR